MNTNTLQDQSLFHISHPDKVVEIILNTDPAPQSMLNAFANVSQELPPKLLAIAAMLKAEAGLGEFEVAEKLAQQVYQTPSHVDLHLIFLITWYDMLLHLDSVPFDQLKALEVSMDSFVTNTTPAEIRGGVNFLKSHTYGIMGNYRKQLQLLQHVVDDVPEQSPYYSKLLALKTMAYLAHGMGKELNVNLSNLPVLKFDQMGLTLASFHDSVITGNLAQALSYLDQAKNFPNHDYVSMLKEQLSKIRALLALMLQQKQQGSLAPDSLFIDQDIKTQNWVKSTQALLDRKPQEALHWARLYIEEKSYATQAFVFKDHTLVRAELAAGNGRAAKYLLEELKDQGSETIFDGFYFARAERLLGNFDSAARHFATLKQAIDRYQAQGRFDFEVALANELNVNDLVNLGILSASVAQNKPTIKVEKIRTKSKGLGSIISISSEMDKVKDLVSRFAVLNQPVLITGETGTGKELVARALHDLSDRKDRPFLAINCSAIPDTLIESELFGHASGAFTGAQNSYAGIFREAGKGTVFLDEIGDISSRLQLALLRVLETGEIRPVGSTAQHEISCRIIAATNKNLFESVNEGNFPADLYFRLQRLEIHIPALRSRSEDIKSLVNHFLNLNRDQTEQATFSKKFIEKLSQYQWRGNVRELRNVIEKLRVINSDKLFYDEDDLTEDFQVKLQTRIIEKSGEIKIRRNQGHRQKFPPVATEDVKTMLANSETSFRRKNALRQLLEEVKDLKVSEVSRIFSVSRKTASRYMIELCREGYIKKVTPGLSPRSHYYTRNL